MALKKQHNLNRREQLYSYIIGRMMFESTWYVDESLKRKLGGHKTYEEAEADFHLANNVKKGDIVICSTSICRQSHVFLIGRLLEYDYGGKSVIQDVITGDLCDYGNESFTAIRNIPSHLLLTDKQYKFWKTFCNSCYKVDSYNLIPFDCSFHDESKIATFKTRQRYASISETKPQTHELKYGMTGKAIREYLEKCLKSAAKKT